MLDLVENPKDGFCHDAAQMRSLTFKDSDQASSLFCLGTDTSWNLECLATTTIGIIQYRDQTCFFRALTFAGFRGRC